MHAGISFSIPNGVAKLIPHRDLEHFKDAWQQVFSRHAKDHRYYDIVDQTLDGGFEYFYLAFEDRSGRIRAIQPLFFVRQNLVEGLPGRLRSVVDFIRKKFPPFLTMRALMVGCAAGEGHLATYSPEDEAWVAEALHASLDSVAREKKASLIVLKDFPSRYRATLDNFFTKDYTRVPSMPLTRLALNHADFDAYLSTLGKATRKGLRRKFRKAERAAKIEMEMVTDIHPYIDEIYPLYFQVHERSPLKFETLTREFFISLSQRMPDRTRFFIWRQKGKVVAFSLCLVHGDTLYDECLGLDYSVALELHLYFYTLRDIISWALKQRLKYYRSTQLNYDPKLHLGCHLVPLDLYVRHTAAWINPIFSRALKYLEPTRHEPLLRKFPNADELN
jgi:hypothetical protein